MPATPLERATVECRTPEGRLLATVDILPAGRVNVPSSTDHPLVRLPTEEARMYAEEPVQLCERGRYEYRLKPSVTAPANLALLPQRGIHPSRVETDGDDRGLIEPGDHCGLLPLVVIQRNDAEQRPLAWGAVEVRPIKLGYREHYRGMLSFIAEKCAGLLLDCRAPTRLRLETLWREDARILEQQLEFLRHTIQSPSFRGAVDEVLRNPHRRLEEEREDRDICRREICLWHGAKRYCGYLEQKKAFRGDSPDPFGRTEQKGHLVPQNI